MVVGAEKAALVAALERSRRAVEDADAQVRGQAAHSAGWAQSRVLLGGLVARRGRGEAGSTGLRNDSV